MASTTVQNYLKQLYAEQLTRPGQLVPLGRVASAMGVTPGTATSMVKSLAADGLVRYEPREGVRLSSAGEQAALRVLQRHRLIEQFLVQVVGLDWTEVHDEAEHLEHAVSDRLLERIDALLGHPQTDPHGDPIPKTLVDPVGGGPDTLWIAADPLQTLDDCPLHAPMRVVRVGDQEPQFLRFARQWGLIPGAVVVAESRDASAQATTLRTPAGAALSLGTAAAAKILVEAAEPELSPARSAPGLRPPSAPPG